MDSKVESLVGCRAPTERQVPLGASGYKRLAPLGRTFKPPSLFKKPKGYGHLANALSFRVASHQLVSCFLLLKPPLKLN